MKQKKMRGTSSKVKTEKRDSVNFTAMEFAEILSMKETAGVQSQSAFIKARIFNETFRVIKSNFTEKKAYAMLAQLEKLTLELAAIGGEIVQLTREFQEKWSQK